MLILRRLAAPLPRFAHRLYTKKAPLTAAMKQVHKDQLQYVDCNAKITIRSDIYMKIQSSDVIDYPDGNALQGQLYGGPVNNCTADMKFFVNEDEKKVEVVCTKLADDSDFYCVLSVPIRADLNIETKDSVSLQNMYSHDLKIKADKNIKTKDIRSDQIELCSQEGNINCQGTLLADITTVETKSGEIFLDKPQGNLLECKTTDGMIKTASCYAESSKFTTDSGAMDLKNVHKKSQVFVYKKGDLNMTGFHGNIYVRSNGGNMNLQLSELSGENIIMADEIEQATVNISDAIEENSYIEVTASTVSLDSPLSHLSDGLSEDQTLFRMSTERDNNNKLLICTKGKVKLGKLSWADSMKISMGLGEK